MPGVACSLSVVTTDVYDAGHCFARPTKQNVRSIISTKRTIHQRSPFMSSAKRSSVARRLRGSHTAPLFYIVMLAAGLWPIAACTPVSK